MEAIILAGGKGTRLRSVVSDVPKPMAPLDAKGTPFLAFLLAELQNQGVTRVILSVGYKAEIIEDYFGTAFTGSQGLPPLELIYAREEQPLGTGGGVKAALELCREPQVFLLNGDTFFDVNLTAMRQWHYALGADVTLAAKEMFDFDRYGTLELTGGRIVSFREKEPCERGLINGGVYLLARDLLQDFAQEKFSLEQDFLVPRVADGSLLVAAYKSNGYFVDIGIPEDYFRAQHDLLTHRV